MIKNRCNRRGFTLTELVVVSGIASMAFALGAPVMDKGREEADRRKCQYNLQQLAVAMHGYANVNGGFPRMAMAWTRDEYRTLHTSAPGDWYDGHGWYSLIAPYIGEPEWASLLDLSVSLSSTRNSLARRRGLQVKIYACPADIGLQRNEWPSSSWARVRGNYVVNAGNTNYGQSSLGTTPFLAAPFAGDMITPLVTVTDGLSNTLLMSEVIVLPTTPYWGGAYSDTQSAIGGHMFTSYNPPNSNTPDAIAYGRGIQADFLRQGIPYPVSPQPVAGLSGPKLNYVAPRSKHPGGINVSLCDGSVRFLDDTIDPAVWRALSTARGAESAIPAEVKVSGKGK